MMKNLLSCIPVQYVEENGKVSDFAGYHVVTCPGCGKGMFRGERGKVEVEAGRAEMLCAWCCVPLWRAGLVPPPEKVKRLSDGDN